VKIGRWADGDQLVIRAGAPLPAICVFCGAPAVAGIQGAILTRSAFGSLQVAGTRIPLCDDDRRAHRFIVVRGIVWVVVGFLVLMFTGRLPGLPGLFAEALNPYGGTLPGVRAVVLAVLIGFAGWFVRFLLRRSGEAPRPLSERQSKAGIGGSRRSMSASQRSRSCDA
jgi:hypothetical protein